MKRSKVFKLNNNDFSKLVKNSKSYSDVLKELGLTTKGGNSSKLLKQRIVDLGIDTSHFEKEGVRAQAVRRTDIKDILVENSTYLSISRLKIRLVNENILKYECSICKNTGEWNGQALSLQLDHINGVNNDHRIENKRFLCPNCHSQTSTYSGRNKGVSYNGSTRVSKTHSQGSIP